MLYKNLDRRRKLLFDIGLGFQGGGASYPSVLDDGNTVLWLDYEQNVTKDASNRVSKWEDRLGGVNYVEQLTQAAQPTINSNGVLFDGVDDFMRSNAFTYEQPEQIYIVFKQVTWTDSDRIFDAHSVVNYGALIQGGVSPNLRVIANATGSSNSDLPVDEYGVARILINRSNSYLQINEGTKVIDDFGIRDMDGITLGTRATAGAIFSNIEVKEIILRNIADSESDSDEIYEYLKKKIS